MKASKEDFERLRLQVVAYRNKEQYEAAWAEYETALLEGKTRSRWVIERDRRHIQYLANRSYESQEALAAFNRKHPTGEAT